MTAPGNEMLETILKRFTDDTEKALEKHEYTPRRDEVGTVITVGKGFVTAEGLPGVRYDELLNLKHGKMGFAFNLDPESVSVVLLDESDGLESGDEIDGTGRVMDVPVGPELLGRVVDPAGRPLDEGGSIDTRERLPVERSAPEIMDRAPVEVPLLTGIQSIDALIPIGRGQRELILGDRQTGKTAVAMDTMVNQKSTDVICVYCGIGKRSSAAAKVVEDLKSHGIMDKTIVMLTAEEDPPGLEFIAPYAATSMGEYFMEQGEDVLIVYDDLTRHARAYRELSLLLRRPPAREAYPGDIFYIHSRLLERSTHLREEKNGGSLTALPIIETQAQNISAYIPTNLISITDGQIYLSPRLFQAGVLPAVEIGESVSRVGGKTQFPAYREVAGDLKLYYSRFKELESFARFSTRLDEATRKTLERGKRVREVLKQPQFSPIPAPEQIAVLLAVTEGLLDGIPLENIRKARETIRNTMKESFPGLSRSILDGEKLSGDDKEELLKALERKLESTGS